MLVGLVAGLVGAVLFGVGAVIQAHAVRRLDQAPDRLLPYVGVAVRDPLTMSVIGMYLLGFLLHAVAIWTIPLYLAQATVAMSLPVTAVASRVLHERLSPLHWSALALVTAGLVLAALGSGDPGPVVTTTAFVGGLAGLLVVLALAAPFGGRLGGAPLGALAGLGYAGSAIAVRGVGTPVDGQVVAAVVVVPLLSVIAFWLYSLGMGRAGVSAVTAPLIVLQTGVPSVVGVALLGDEVRPGWWPAVVAGLVLAVSGALLLSREDGSGT